MVRIALFLFCFAFSAFGTTDSVMILEYVHFKKRILESKFGKLAVGEEKMDNLEKYLGPPEELVDLENYKDTMRTIVTSGRPLLKYKLDSSWQVFIYAIKSNLSEISQYDSVLYDNVGSVDFIPRGRVKLKIDTSKMENRKVIAADAAWTNFIDNNFQISIYLGKVPYGTKTKGDLNRISIKPPEIFRKPKSK